MIAALQIFAVQSNHAHADAASCIEKVAAYVVELDDILSREKNRITPFNDLNYRYMPLDDCEAESLLVEVGKSQFLQSKRLNRGNVYVIVFSNGSIEVGFGYSPSLKISKLPYARHLNEALVL